MRVTGVVGQLVKMCNGCGSSRTLGILGVPFEKGQPKEGTAAGPKFIRKTGFIEDLRTLGHNVEDYGDVLYKPNKAFPATKVALKHLDHVSGCNQAVAANVEHILKKGQICVTLGGDHSIGLGTLQGHSLSQPEDHLSVLWVDAHADINTPLTSITGNFHGSPVNFNLKELVEFNPVLPGLEWVRPRLSARNIAYIGLRSVDAYERLIIQKLGIAAFSMREVHCLGIEEVTRRALNLIDPDGTRSLHVSFDIDALDVAEAPSTGTPVRGGLTLREGIHLMEDVAATGRLNALDLVEVNPKIGSERDLDLTLTAAKHLLLAAFGSKRQGDLLEGLVEIPRA